MVSFFIGEKMKKIIFSLLMFWSLLAVCYANEINNIDMDIFIDEFGNAHVTEYWDMDNDRGTEIYKGYANIGESVISNFQVSEGDKVFESLSSWDINESFSNKAYKSGINYTNDGLELCWGISNYGKSKYKLTYNISNFVIDTTDSQMIYWNLISRDMNILPQHYDITISSDYYFEDDIDVWGYGVKGDYAYVSNGEIKLSSEDSMKSDEYVTILVKLPQEAFKTFSSVSNDFDYYYSMAEKGASHVSEFNSDIILFIVMIAITLIITFTAKGLASIKYGPAKYTTLKYKDVPNKIEKDNPKFREIPCEKDIFIASYISWVYDISRYKNNFIGCLLLKWLKDNLIKIETVNKDEKVIKFLASNLPDNYTIYQQEVKMFNWMYSASKDNILKRKDFEKFCQKEYKDLLNWFDDNFKEVRNVLFNKGWLTDSKEKKHNNKNNFYATFKLYEEACKVDGLRKFLVVFSNMKDKEPIEVHLWQDYLIFAQMFGIAKKVAKQFKDFYPEIANIADFDYATFIFINSFSYNSYSSASSARNAAISYSAGGGGFSAGGGGGGSFGSGGGGGWR